MKILHVAFFSPLPMHNGSQIREFSLIQPLLKNNSVALISFEDSIDSESANELDQMYESVSLVRLPKPKRGTLTNEIIRGIKHLFSTRPPVSVDHYSVEMHNLIRNILESQSFDLIYVDLLWMLEYLPSDLIQDTPVVLSTHNVEYKALESFANLPATSLGSMMRKLYFKLSSWKMKRYETQMLHRTNHVLAVSEKDKESLELITDKKVTVMPNAAEVPQLTRSESSVRPNSIVFVGSMNYKPNIQAVQWFCNHIMPRIREDIPDATFTIVGANPTEEVLRLQNEYVNVTGTVPEIKPYLDQAACFVAPLFSGGGTNMKVIEAMAAGIPVVSTSKGIEGLSIIPEKHVLKANGEDEFADSVLRVINDKKFARKLGEAGRELVLAKYSWEKVQQDMKEFIETTFTN